MFEKLAERIKRLFSKKDRPRSGEAGGYVADQIGYEKNTIYRNNANGEARMKLWMDDVLDKHHGGLTELDDDY